MAPSSSSQGMLGRGGQGWFERGTTASYIMAAVGGMVLGMVVAMFFDPRSGRRRRHLTYDRMGRMFRQSGRRMGRTRRGIIARNRGMQKRMAHRGGVEHPFVDDRTLESRVQSMIFRETEAPKGDVSISVVEGFVELRGALPSAFEAEQLVRAAAAIPGVRGVHNYLHPIGTDAPNKVDAIEASEMTEHYMHDRTLP